MSTATATAPTPAPVEHAADLRLAILAVAGSEDAWATIFARIVPRLQSFAIRLTSNPAVAEDLVQDTLLQLCRGKLSLYRGEAALSTYVTTICVNLWKMERRPKQARPSRYTQQDADPRISELPPFLAHSIADHTAFSESDTALRLTLSKAIASLTPIMRRAFLLHDVYGWSHIEISKALGYQSRAGSKAALHKARLYLRQVLSGQCPIHQIRRGRKTGYRAICNPPVYK